MSAPEAPATCTPSTSARPATFSGKQIIPRALVVLLNASSIGLLWWSLQHRLLPLQDQIRQLTRTVDHLASDVSQMERAWTVPVVQDVRDKFEEAQSRMFKGRGAMETWLAALQPQIAALALDVDVNLTNATTPAVSTAPDGATRTRALIAVRPSPDIEAIASPFQRVLRLSQILAGDERRADLVGLKVAGGMNSVSRALIELDLWTKEGRDAP